MTVKTAGFRVDGKGLWRWVLLNDEGTPIADAARGYRNVQHAIRDFEQATGAVIEPEHKQVAVRTYAEYAPQVDADTTRLDLTAAAGVPHVHIRQVAEAIEVKGLEPR